MASSSDIGAANSSYQGNAGLGGGTFGSFKLDTQPIEDLAKYTMLYNKAEYDQRQKDAEKAAAEIADMTSYDLTSSIPKDAKLLQEKYDKLIDFARRNPGALDYRNKEQWATYKKMRNDLDNDLASGKQRSLLYKSREKEIADEPNEDRKKLLRENLDKDVNSTDIRTPIPFTQQYDLSMPEMPKAQGVTFDVIRAGDNQDFKREYNLWDVANARATSNVFALGLNSKSIDETTDAGKQQAIAKKGNFWVTGSEQFNAALSGYKDPKTGIIDESKVKGISSDLLNLIKKTNEYLTTKSSEIKAGVYTDKLHRPIAFGTNGLKEEDYKPINYQDGISADELALVASYASWKGDGFKTSEVQTNDAIEKMRINAENYRAKLTQNGENYRANLPYEKLKMQQTNDAGKEFGNILYGAHADELKTAGSGLRLVDQNGTPYKLINGAVVNSAGAVVNMGKEVEFSVPAISIPNSIITEFNKYAGTVKYDQNGKIVKGETTSLLKADKDGNYIIRIGADGIINGIKATDPNDPKNSTFADIDQFQYITTQASQKGVTKYKKPEDISGGNTPTNNNFKPVKVKGL